MTSTRESLGPYVEPPSIPEGVTFSDLALVLAEPPEAGWRVGTRSNEEATVDAELLAAPGRTAFCAHVHSTLRRAAPYPKTPGQNLDRQDQKQTINRK